MSIENIRTSIIVLGFRYSHNDPNVKALLKSEIMEFAALHKIPIKTNMPKKGLFKSTFIEFVENKTGYIEILQKLYDSV